MKIKKSRLKELVKKVIEVVKIRPDWSLEGNALSIENFQLDDGRVISAEVKLTGEWENSGIGNYEFWGQRGFDKGTNSFTITDYWVERITDDETDKIIWNRKNQEDYGQIDKEANAAILDFVDTNQDAIADSYMDNQPDGPEDRDYLDDR